MGQTFDGGRAKGDAGYARPVTKNKSRFSTNQYKGS